MVNQAIAVDIVMSTETNSTLVGSFFLNFRYWKHYVSVEAFEKEDFHKISVEILDVGEIQERLKKKFMHMEIDPNHISSSISLEALMLYESEDKKLCIDPNFFTKYLTEDTTVDKLFTNEQQAEEAFLFWKNTVLIILS